ncbi:hypothetical protein NDU88_002032 [Pleurodeles waltl]|uniref:Uncharacterized protein n=1 Tax=Pleurodeles waltl TaxID=8319 RepID=A0AAV7NCG4_PLEWA|nr:hypothetical protein NDU88_002032 [Pleurodeles waltl]
MKTSGGSPQKSMAEGETAVGELRTKHVLCRTAEAYARQTRSGRGLEEGRALMHTRCLASEAGSGWGVAVSPAVPEEPGPGEGKAGAAGPRGGCGVVTVLPSGG